MCVETFQWLHAHSSMLGINPNFIGPASVDLALGDIQPLMVDAARQSILLIPGAFYLASTVEYVRVPTSHCAFLQMRSSLARKGLGHKMAGFIDPGFEGEITMELETALPIETYYGERVIQLIYIRLTEPTDKPYAGRYKGQRGPTGPYRA